MNKTILAVLLVALVLGAAGVSFAGPNDKWTVYVRATDSAAGNYLVAQTIFGTLPTASDGLEISPANDASAPAGSGKAVAVTCFDLGAGDNGNGYSKDQRAPIVIGQQKVWNLRLWVQSGWTSGAVILSAWNSSGSAALNGSFPVVLKVVSDPTGSYAPNTTLFTWNAPATMPPVTFNNTDAIKGGTTYVHLQLIAGMPESQVPEPGTMAAVMSLVSGLIGVTAWGKRRS